MSETDIDDWPLGNDKRLEHIKRHKGQLGNIRGDTLSHFLWLINRIDELEAENQRLREETDRLHAMRSDMNWASGKEP